MGYETAGDEAALAEVLEEGDPVKEGPLVCALFGKELEGTQYEGLWISREKKGIYLLGDEHTGSCLPSRDPDGARIHPRIRVAVTTNGTSRGKKVVGNQLLIGG